MLEQQELLEAAPARRVIVPRGHSAWWGVDPNTRRTALAAVSRALDGSLVRQVWMISYAPVDGAQRLSVIYAATRGWVASIAAAAAPGAVFIEQPSGKQENPALSYTVGVIQAAVFDGVRDATNFMHPHLETVTSSRWKKVACGRGNIYKPKRKGEEYGVLTWARSNGYDGWSWDEADALGVAECARRSITLDER